MASDTFQETKDKDAELKERLSQARKRVAENPKDRDAQNELADVCGEGERLWQACEVSLSRRDQTTTDGEEHAMLVREINIARNHVKAYGTESANAIRAADSIKTSVFDGLFKAPAPAAPKPKQPKPRPKEMSLPMRILGIVVALFVFLFVIVPFGNKANDKANAEKKSIPEEQAEAIQEPESTQEQAPEPEHPAPATEQDEQVLFDGDTMRVVFEDWKEESYIDGCCYLYLGVENKTGSEVWFHAAYGTSSVNGYNGMFMQGMPTYVQPGNKAIMGIVLTYKQFGVSSFDEVHTCDFELVQEDKNNIGSEFARAYIHVER